MLAACVDIGSNTIRLSIYRLQEKRLFLLLHKKKTAGLAAHVEKKELTQEGINKVCNILREFQEIWENCGIDKVFLFATAAIRNVKNRDQVISYIFEQTHLHVEVLSGDQEARFSFYGATYSLDLHDGLLIDLGGGSTEIVRYVNREIAATESLPMGSLNLYHRHVKKLFPKKEERRKMKDEIRSHLRLASKVNGEEVPAICGVGGSIRAALKIQEQIFCQTSEQRVITTDSLQKMLHILRGGHSETLHRILSVVPDRVHTILPGMILLYEIVKYFHSEKIYVSHYGVREGYMYNKLILNIEGGKNGEKDGKKFL